MPAKPIRRSALLALALLMAAAVPVRATTPPTFTVVDSILPGGDSSYAMDYSESVALGDYLYFRADDGTHGTELWRINDMGASESAVIPGTNAYVGCMCSPLSAIDGRLFVTMYSDEIGSEFAYLDEPTFVLPETNREGSVWSTALVILAALTAVAGVGLRLRKGSLAK